jgi:iron complex outermembrane receptor protein
MIEPFIGLNNLLNTSYNSNIRMNAWGGRYFEPGSEFNIYGGVSIRFE